MSRTSFIVNPHYSLPECQGTPCSKLAPYLKFKWQQRDSNPQPLRSQAKLGQDSCETFCIGVPPKTRNDLKRPETIWNDLKRPTTSKKRPETTWNEQETTWNDLQRARNDFKRPTTSKKQPEITWNNLEWARNNVLFTYFLHWFQTFFRFDIFCGCCL